MTATHRWCSALNLFLLSAALGGALRAADSIPAPSPLHRWGERDAAHLLRRAGFGGSPEQIAFLAGLGKNRAVDYLVDYDALPLTDAPFPAGHGEIASLERRIKAIDQEGERQALRVRIRDLHRTKMDALRAWWIRRMVATSRPLQEKMTLFWHGHLTSGFREVRSWKLLYEQNAFFRENALGDFETVLKGISRDGAMLRYLNNDRNAKSHPNENYARELLELFSLGEGHYSEQDIREVARAFTGWRLDGEDRFFIDPVGHDKGLKTVFGSRGRYDGNDVVRLILKQGDCSRYMAERLWSFFAYPDPDPEIVEWLARKMRECRFDFKEVMRSLLKSEPFYSGRARWAKIKSPVELAVGAARMLDLDAIDANDLVLQCRLMGQSLFQPPNVKGWDGEEKWITTNTLFLRYNLGRRLLEGAGGQDREGRGPHTIADAAMERDGDVPAAPGRGGAPVLGKGFLEGDRYRPYDPTPTLIRYGLSDGAEIVGHYVERLLQRELPEERFRLLCRAFSPAERPFRAGRPDAAKRVREIMVLIMSMPEFQIN